MTGAGTAPKPSFSGSLKFFSASRTPGAMSGPRSAAAQSAAARSAAEVSIAAVEPVLPRRIEHVHIQRVLERQCPVGQVRRDHENLARADDDLTVAVRAQPKVQRAFEDIGDLFILVRMAPDPVSFLEVDMRDHHAL